MNTTLRNILAVIAGIFVGSIVNMGIVNLSGALIPPPDGVDMSDMESMKASFHLFEPRHFILPFVAHALGTLVGAYVAGRIAFNHKMKFALSIGGFFLIGGLTMVLMLPSPIWFALLDLSCAYIPMAWLGGKLASGRITK